MSRFKICTYELGDKSLTGEELQRVYHALETEVRRLLTTASEVRMEIARTTPNQRGPIFKGPQTDADDDAPAE